MAHKGGAAICALMSTRGLIQPLDALLVGRDRGRRRFCCWFGSGFGYCTEVTSELTTVKFTMVSELD
jgi:hypothetical protein